MKAADKSSRVGALASTDGLILLDISTKFGPDTFCVANPVLRQLIKIPQHPNCFHTDNYQGEALVTNMNNSDLLGYKVVRYELRMRSRNRICFQVYSSDSGNWTFQSVCIERNMVNPLPSNPINLNGYLHWLCRESQIIVACNFYASTQRCHVIIYLPQNSASIFERPKNDYEETLTISCGSLMYMKTVWGREPNQKIKIWRLKNYTTGSLMETWELLCDLRPDLNLNLANDPVAMHPFDKEIVYLVTRQTDYLQTHAYLVTGNLRTKKVQLHKDWEQEHRELGDYRSHLFHQFLFPQRLSSIPCPPGCTLVTLPDQHH